MDMKFGNVTQSQVANSPLHQSVQHPIATPPSVVEFITIITL
jgi:hypothetical protein